jgi:hypothetical protein
VAVVTATDEDSARIILARHGLAGTTSEVVGECGRKAEAVRDLCARRDSTPDQVTFVDGKQ